MAKVNAHTMSYQRYTTIDNPCYVSRNTIATLLQHFRNALGMLLEFRVWGFEPDVNGMWLQTHDIPIWST